MRNILKKILIALAAVNCLHACEEEREIPIRFEGQVVGTVLEYDSIPKLTPNVPYIGAEVVFVLNGTRYYYEPTSYEFVRDAVHGNSESGCIYSANLGYVNCSDDSLLSTRVANVIWAFNHVPRVYLIPSPGQEGSFDAHLPDLIPVQIHGSDEQFFLERSSYYYRTVTGMADVFGSIENFVDTLRSPKNVIDILNGPENVEYNIDSFEVPGSLRTEESYCLIKEGGVLKIRPTINSRVSLRMLNGKELTVLTGNEGVGEIVWDLTQSPSGSIRTVNALQMIHRIENDPEADQAVLEAIKAQNPKSAILISTGNAFELQIIFQ